MMAVRKLMGLKRWLMQRVQGVTNSALHLSSWAHLSINSLNHRPRFFLLGQASFSHEAGTLLKVRDLWSASIASVMLRAPVRPSLKSSRLRLIYPRRVFILSHSCRHTTTQGVLSLASLILAVMSSIEYPSGALPLRSEMMARVCSSLPPPAPPEPPSRSRMVSKRVSH